MSDKQKAKQELIQELGILRQRVADLEQSELANKRDEVEAKRLAKENAIMAEIGRIISSTIDIEEVYERFAEEVRKLMPFDQILVSTHNLQDQTLAMAYVAGIEIEGRRQGSVLPLSGTLAEEVAHRRSSIVCRMENEREITDRYSALLIPFRAGIRLAMAIPLISKDQVIGSLHFWSCEADAYTPEDLKLAERVATQIAGAIANAQLFDQVKQAEEALRQSEGEAKRLSQENAIMAEIGQVISSTLQIEEVYERFVEKVRLLIPFERLSVNLINEKENTTTIKYVAGTELEDRRTGHVGLIGDSLTGRAIRNRSSLLINVGDREALSRQFPGLAASISDAFRSLITVPLISKDRVIGVLHLRSTETNIYSEKDLRIAERISNQIAGAIANAELFDQFRRAEAALKKSEERFRDLYDEAPAGYYEIDLQGRITNVNQTQLEMLGYNREEMIGEFVWRFIVEEETSRQRILSKLSGTLPSDRNLERTYRRKDGTTLPALIENRLIRNDEGEITGSRGIIQDITERKRVEKEREKLIHELQYATSQIKTLSGLLPICASCKRIRDDKGYWNQMESYIRDHSEAEFTHGVCPECVKKLYGDILDEKEK